MDTGAVRDLIDYNKTIKDTDKGTVTSSKCHKQDIKKLILYNIRYGADNTVRSDIDVLDDYNTLVETMDMLEKARENITREIECLQNPSTLERLNRTLVTWAWSDDPRKERLHKLKHLKGALKDAVELMNDIDFQLPLYKSVISVTTTSTIKIKQSKHQYKYARKLKKKT